MNRSRLSWNPEIRSAVAAPDLAKAELASLRKRFTRRELLRGAFAAGGTLLVGLERLAPLRASQPGLQAGASSAARTPASTQGGGAGQGADSGFAGGKLLGNVDFSNEARVPIGASFGAELDERLYTDLSKLAPGNLVTPASEFYVRTGASKLLDAAKISSVKFSGLVEKPLAIGIPEIARQAKSMGAHLMECAGNARGIHFGMMSAAEWNGVAAADILSLAHPASAATHVLISGFDEYAATSASSMPGASWIFSLEALRSANAFFATQMNDEPLSRDHGAPLRLMVPGWYGCCCIKWVNELAFVDETAATTSQMQEYASRTMQKGVPESLRDYEPATIDAAAMPVRIEKWAVASKVKYRVVGILWGASPPAKALEIRFNPEEDYAPVEHVEPPSDATWSLWTHAWSPRAPGPYIIRLRVNDPHTRTRRLDAGAYVRSVEIGEV
jgi:DMSO/TMAO reductase YedYZ molybdopterin-dependent catalytic subunit